ncbi:MAG: hypothetical protein GY856_28075, partial [bacterium]|nr:hypothetical protein [bacterium]
AAAMAAGQTINAADYQVNPPYTPKLKSLRVDYTSTLEIDIGRARSGDGRACSGDVVDGVFHFRPFGYSDLEAERASGQLPPFLPPYQDQGALYLGLRDARPPQTVSLLFQMAEGSADPDLEREPIRWSYLSGDRWLTLDDGNVVVDTTRGLVNSGLIAIALEPAAASTRVAGDFYWLRATIARNPGSVCDAVAVHAQAAAATFVDQDNASDHFARPLPAETITRLVETRPEIAAVYQPYTSWGGRMAEEAELFNTRVSERLRHKGRALSTWDYERLVLERFPEIYKAKCIPAHLAGTFDPPGKVRVVVIPD